MAPLTNPNADELLAISIILYRPGEPEHWIVCGSSWSYFDLLKHFPIDCRAVQGLAVVGMSYKR